MGTKPIIKTPYGTFYTLTPTNFKRSKLSYFPLKNLPFLFPPYLKASQQPEFKMLKSSHTLPTSLTSSHIIICTGNLNCLTNSSSTVPNELFPAVLHLITSSSSIRVHFLLLSLPSNHLYKGALVFNFLYKFNITSSLNIMVPHCLHDKDWCFSWLSLLA